MSKIIEFDDRFDLSYNWTRSDMFEDMNYKEEEDEEF